jgi:hypothetical protein
MSPSGLYEFHRAQGDRTAAMDLPTELRLKPDHRIRPRFAAEVRPTHFNRPRHSARVRRPTNAPAADRSRRTIGTAEWRKGLPMPTGFHDRERGFEAKFAHDEELRFLVAARADKLFARWVAATLGLDNDAAETLLRQMLAIPNRAGHDQAIMALIVPALSTHAPGLHEQDLYAALDDCRQQALRQLTHNPPATL